MAAQHISMTVEDYNSAISAGIIPNKPAKDPFTLQLFNSWIEHPIHGMIPMYGTDGGILTAISTIADPNPSDELQTRPMTSLAYDSSQSNWIEDIELGMQVIWQQKLSTYEEIEGFWVKSFDELKNYRLNSLVEKINSIGLNEYDVWGILDIDNRTGDHLLEPNNTLLNDMKYIRENLDGWLIIEESGPVYKNEEEWLVLYQAYLEE